MPDLNDLSPILGDDLPISLAPVSTATLSRGVDGHSSLTVAGVCPFVYLRVDVLGVPISPRPEWGKVWVVATRPPVSVSPKKTNYHVLLDVTELLGAQGIEVVAANGTTRLGSAELFVPPSHVSSVAPLRVSTTADGALVVDATGRVSSSGWTSPRLVPRTPYPDASGEIVLDFVADRPSGMVATVMVPVGASWTWPQFAAEQAAAQRVRVVAQTNEVTFSLPMAPEGPNVAATGITFQELVALPAFEAVPVDGGRLTLTLVSITDSRCPDGMICIWEGEVTALIEASVGESTAHVRLTSRLGGGGDIPGGYRLELKDTFLYPQVLGASPDTVTVLVMR